MNSQILEALENLISIIDNNVDFTLTEEETQQISEAKELLASSQANSKPYVLIVVEGGIADIGQTEGAVSYDILDIDGLEQDIENNDDFRLSEHEEKYLEKNYPRLYQAYSEKRSEND